MGSTLIITALLLGLTTSLHCVGMCGPIAFSLGLGGENQWKFASKNLTYQLGRVTTYSIMGLIIGAVGQGISMVGFQQYISILAGILMIAFVVLPKDLTQSNAFFAKILVRIKMTLGKLIQKKNYTSLYTIGLLNGLLPCGPVYIALSASLAAGTLLGSTFFMTLFGIGTIPLMFSTVLFGQMVSLNLRNKILKIFPYVMVVIGVLFILRGMNLGIPFISPALEKLNLVAPANCH